MTLEEAIKHAEEVADGHDRIKQIKAVTLEECRCAEEHRQLAEWLKDYKRLLEQQPCEDAISRQTVLEGLASIAKAKAKSDAQKSLMGRVMFFTEQLPPVTPQKKMGKCKDCKYFEYDIVAKVDGIPLIVAHEICKRWGDGCQSKEDGYCFLFEPKMQEVEGDAE